jgi:hypothetical protein
MGHLHRVLSAAVVIGLSSGGVCPAPALAQSFARTGQPAVASRSVLIGAISGTVSDEHGGPLAGATVSVFGAMAAMDVTDARGRFSLEKLPIGNYTLHARLPGFAASRRETVRINSGIPAIYRLQLKKLDRAVGTTGAGPNGGPTIIAAGFDLPRIEPAEPTPARSDPPPDDHSHTETAWWLRHLPRSILKDSTGTLALGEDDSDVPAPSRFDRPMDASPGFAPSLFGALPFSGEVNLLTTGAFGHGGSLSGDMLPRGVAYLSIGAPTPAGDWTMRAAMGEGDLSSWIVAGSFVSHPGSAHAYDLGFSYSTQEYQGGNPMALAAVSDGSRNVGEVTGLDRWTVSPGVIIEYGGRYARYDYLEDRGLLSPRLGFALAPTKSTRVSATLSQRMVAPGAEEFLSPRVPGPWLPPERTFSALGRHGLQVERARSLDVLFEHEFDRAYVLGVRRFFQEIDNQIVTLFGLTVPGGPESVGHYYVADGGGASAQGWGVRLGTPRIQGMRASVDYSLIHTQWGSPSRGSFGAWKSAAAVRELEDVHDVTTSFEADIAETATRVFVLYKVNSAYARATSDGFRPGLDGRFDMQVNQALPFGLAGTKWEVLVGLRNLFRDPNDPASVYDELLVVRPPKRIVGGFLVRF